MNNTEQQNQSKKHRWYDVIVAWANGQTIQYRTIIKHTNDIVSQSPWEDYNPLGHNAVPGFNFCDISWRVKPKTVTKRYRMALVARESSRDVIAVETTYSTIDDPVEYNTQGFIRWVGDSVELEVESNV